MDFCWTFIVRIKWDFTVFMKNTSFVLKSEIRAWTWIRSEKSSSLRWLPFNIFKFLSQWRCDFCLSPGAERGQTSLFSSLPLKEKRLEPQRNPRESSAVFMLVFTLCSKSSKRQDSTEVQEPVLERLKTTVTSVCRRPLYLCISPGWTYVKALRI